MPDTDVVTDRVTPDRSPAPARTGGDDLAPLMIAVSASRTALASEYDNPAPLPVSQIHLAAAPRAVVAPAGACVRVPKSTDRLPGVEPRLPTSRQVITAEGSRMSRLSVDVTACRPIIAAPPSPAGPAPKRSPTRRPRRANTRRRRLLLSLAPSRSSPER